MMSPNLPNRPNREPLSESDGRALDALLGEIQQLAPAPPDLTDAILRKLAQHDWNQDHLEQPALAPSLAQSRKQPEAVDKRHRRALLISVVATVAMAACVLMALSRWEYGSGVDNQVAKGESGKSLAGATKSKPLAADNAVIAEESKTETNSQPTQPALAKKTEPRQGVPLVRSQSSEPSGNALNPELPKDVAVAAARQGSVQEKQLMLRLNDSLTNYWARLGVTPAATISDSEFVSRVKERFGTSPALLTEDECREFASRLVKRLMRDVPLENDAREKMMDQATVAIHQGERFDELISRWVADSSLFDTRKPELLSQGLGTNLLGVDAACAKCHDSPVDGRFAQHDYWSLASVFVPSDRPPLFYELADGRQRAAEARIPERWIGETASAPVARSTDLKQQFSQSILGNREVAASLANQIWDIGFGAPLVSRASDPIAPPRDDALQASHAVLTDAILGSSFDLRIAARMVIASDAMWRGSSELYATDRWRLAAEESIAKDALARRAFAASSPTNTRMNRENLVAMIESRIGNTPREIGSPDVVLAQPKVSNSGQLQELPKSEKPQPEEYLWAEWIADRDLLRDSWLHWIKDLDEQQRHAFYAANLSPPAENADWVERLRAPVDAQEGKAETANDRLLWVLRKSR